MKIELAKAGEAGEVAQEVGTLLEEIMAAIGQQAFNFDQEEAAQRLAEYIEKEKCFVLIARNEEGTLAGFIAMYESVALYAEGIFGTISEFFVRPKHRACGLGRCLCEAAKEFGIQKGWRRLEVTTPPLPEFDRTLAFYERQGFSITGGRKLKYSL